MIYVQAIFGTSFCYFAKVNLQTDVLRIQRKRLTMRYLFALCFAICAACEPIGANILGAPPTYMLPSPPEAVIPSQSSSPGGNVGNSGLPATPNTSNSSSTLSWGGVNYPSSSSNSFVMPTQAQIEQDFGILNVPQGMETGENAYSNYGISTPAPVDLEAFEWQVLPRDIMKPTMICFGMAGLVGDSDWFVMVTVIQFINAVYKLISKRPAWFA
jgi:hypothetical protein